MNFRTIGDGMNVRRLAIVVLGFWFVVERYSAGATFADGRPVPVQIQAAPGNLPPRFMLTLMTSSDAVIASTLRAVDATLVEVGDGLRVRTKEGDEFWVRLSLEFSEAEQTLNDNSSLWGLIGVQASADDRKELSEALRKSADAFCPKLVNAWIRQIEITLNRFVEEPLLREIREQQAQADEAAARLAAAEEDLAKLNSQVRALQELVSLPAAVLEKQLSDAVTQRQSLELDVAGLDARGNALESEIRASADEAAKSVNDDEVVANLAKVVDLRRRELKMVDQQVASGQASAREREAAEVQLVTAAADLAEARRTAAKLHGSNMLDLMRSDLLQTASKLTECRVKKDLIEKREAEYRKMLQIETQEIQPWREKIPAAQRLVEELMEAKRAAERELRRLERERQPVLVRKLVPEPPAADEKPPE